MNEELQILRNSTHTAKLVAAKSITPVVTARSPSVIQADAAKMLNLEDENANLRGLLEQARSKIQASTPAGVLITTAVASLHQNAANEVDILRAEISQKNALLSSQATTISQQASSISGLEKEVTRLGSSYADAKKHSEDNVSKLFTIHHFFPSKYLSVSNILDTLFYVLFFFI